jgi:tetratricopeptide (TPR) repeat protein
LKKQQIVLIGSGVALLCFIYFFGRTVPPRKNTGQAPGAVQPGAGAINSASILAASRQQLTASQQAYVSQLETAVVRGDVKEQQIRIYRQLASFWRDSAHLLLPYAYYSGEAAKLENSPKSLTFAAQFFLEGLRRQENPDLKKWMATEAKELFEKALRLNPGNDSLQVGLGSCYLFGNISETPMEGINMIREVVTRNPNNMYAQFMLGMGGMVSGQLDKAIERLSKVAEHEPDNLEAVLVLADAYERTGDKKNAIKWYEAARKNIRDTTVVKEIGQRISLLKK